MRKDLWDCSSIRSVGSRNESDRKALLTGIARFCGDASSSLSLWRVVVMLADFVWEVLASLRNYVIADPENGCTV